MAKSQETSQRVCKLHLAGGKLFSNHKWQVKSIAILMGGQHNQRHHFRIIRFATPVMPKFLTQFQHFVNQQWMTLRFILLAAAILLQCFYSFHLGPMLEHDGGNQIAAVRYVLNGHGVALPIATNSQNLAEITYQPTTAWPIMFTLLLAVFQTVVGDLWWSAMLVQWLNVLIFFSAWFVITETFSDFFSIPVRLALWLFWIIIYNPVVASTDGLNAAIFSGSLALLVVGLKQQKHPWKRVVMSGCMMALAMSLRYAYWPLVVVIPGSLFFYALLSRQYQWIGLAFLHGIISTLGIAVVMLSNYMRVGTLLRSYISVNDEQPGRLLFENLQGFVPFPAQALGAVGNISTIGRELNIPEGIISIVLWLIAVIFILVLVYMVWRTAQKTEANTIHPVYVVFATGLLLTVVTTVFLSYLSITSEKFWGWWIYIQDMRFFQPTLPFIALAVFTLVLQPQKTQPVLFRWIVSIVVVAIIICGMAVRIVNWRWISRTLTFEGGMSRIDNQVILSAVQSIEVDDEPIIFVRGDMFDNGKWDAQAALAGIVIYRGRITAATTFAANSPVILLVGIPQDGVPEQIERLTQLVEQHDGTPVAEIPDFLRLYVVHLE